MVAKLERLEDEFNKQKNRIKIAESKPEFKDIVDKAKPDPVRYIDDCQKGRWGGSNKSAGYTLSASFQKQDQYDETYEITLSVSPNEGIELKGDVYFFLHDSYYPDCIQYI